MSQFAFNDDAIQRHEQSSINVGPVRQSYDMRSDAKLVNDRDNSSSPLKEAENGRSVNVEF